jgi:hypothetical protein
MDTAIANNATYNQGDSATLFTKYWADDSKERRKKLLPFFWSVIESKDKSMEIAFLQNKVNAANPSLVFFIQVITNF